MKTVEELEDEVEDLKKELYFLSKSIQTDSSTDTDDTSTDTDNSDDTSSNSDTWVVLYDKDSEDESINMGETSGLKHLHGVVTDLPDLVTYNSLRVYFTHMGCKRFYDFDISEKVSNNLRILVNNYILNLITGVDMAVYFKDEKFVFYVGNFTQLTFTNNKYTKMSYLTSDSSAYISKICAKTGLL